MEDPSEAGFAASRLVRMRRVDDQESGLSSILEEAAKAEAAKSQTSGTLAALEFSLGELSDLRGDFELASGYFKSANRSFARRSDTIVKILKRK